MYTDIQYAKHILCVLPIQTKAVKLKLWNWRGFETEYVLVEEIDQSG